MIDSFAPIDPKLIDVVLPAHDGYPDELKAGDTHDVLKEACGSASREFPQALWIEPKDWLDAARQNDKHHTWPINYVDRFTNQDPSHECTTHSERTLFEAARNRQRGIIYPGGPKKNFRYPQSARGSVWVSPLSVYIEANPGEWGGANVRQVLEIACRRGHLPDKIQPAEYGFKHSLQGTTGKGGMNQSSGDWISLKQLPHGWQNTAAWFKPLEVIFCDTWEQVVCLVLNGIGYGVGRKGHAIPYTIWNPVEQMMGYVDSYDVVRWDSLSTVKSAISGGFAIASVVAPDDWMKPAG